MFISVVLNLLFLVIGMFLLIKGADFFVDGASRVAKALKIPSLIIGLTLVSIGTSLPELSVSVTAALSGNADISYGNVIGSNIFNVFVVISWVVFIGDNSIFISIFKHIEFNYSITCCNHI